MKKLLYIPLLFIFLVACKSNKEEAEPTSLIDPLVGKWLVKEIELTVNGNKVWQPASPSQPEYLIFRSDGVMLDVNEKASCCGPRELKINGSLYEIKPQTEVVYSLNCAAVDCVGCPVLDVEYFGNEMITSCYLGPRVKYVRI